MLYSSEISVKVWVALYWEYLQQGNAQHTIIRIGIRPANLISKRNVEALCKIH
jgi:hypothetical protein